MKTFEQYIFNYGELEPLRDIDDMFDCPYRKFRHHLCDFHCWEDSEEREKLLQEITDPEDIKQYEEEYRIFNQSIENNEDFCASVNECVPDFILGESEFVHKDLLYPSCVDDLLEEES